MSALAVVTAVSAPAILVGLLCFRLGVRARRHGLDYLICECERLHEENERLIEASVRDDVRAMQAWYRNRVVTIEAESDAAAIDMLIQERSHE